MCHWRLPHEKLLGMPPQDWIQIYTDLENEEKEKSEHARQQREAARAKDTRPSLALEKYAGAYDSAILGGATISVARSGNAPHSLRGGTVGRWTTDPMCGIARYRDAKFTNGDWMFPECR